MVTIERIAARFFLPDIFDIASPSCAAAHFNKSRLQITRREQAAADEPLSRAAAAGFEQMPGQNSKIIVNAPRNLQIP
jgi:hypothetical protein